MIAAKGAVYYGGKKQSKKKKKKPLAVPGIHAYYNERSAASPELGCSYSAWAMTCTRSSHRTDLSRQNLDFV